MIEYTNGQYLMLIPELRIPGSQNHFCTIDSRNALFFDMKGKAFLNSG